MDSTVLLQKQVRDNSNELRSYLNDLVKWEEEMKRKESELSEHTSLLPEVPIIRNKPKQVEEVKLKKQTKVTKPKIKSWDYAAWDKFDVDAELEKVDKPKEEEPDDSDDEAVIEHRNRLREEANNEKGKGNEFVKNKKWDEAISCYTHAIACYSKDPIFYANRGLCFLKQDNFPSAEADCTSALLLEPKYVKALQRRSAARVGLKQYQEALDDLRRVVELEPQNKESKNELAKLEKRLGVNQPEKKQLFPPRIIEMPTNKTAKIVELKSCSNNTNKKLTQSKSDNKITEVRNKKIAQSKSDNKITTELKPDRNKKIAQAKSDDKSTELKSSLGNSGSPNKKLIKPQEDLRREIENDLLELEQKIDYSDTDALAKILAETQQLNVDEIISNIDEENVKNPHDINFVNKTSVLEIEKQSDETFHYSVPKSSIQFYTNWKVMGTNFAHKFFYLKQIKPIDLPEIFQESLESDVFSGILLVLNECFVPNELEIFPYLLSLSKVKRFSTLTMFMGQNDKKVLKNLFGYCQAKENVPPEEMNALRKKFEL